QRPRHERRLRPARVHRRGGPRGGRRLLALPHAQRVGAARSRPRRDVVPAPRHEHGPDRHSRLHRLLGDGLDPHLLPPRSRGPPLLGNQALGSIAAAVLGGASLGGGKGSYVGTLLATLFLTLIDNVLPLFQKPTEYAEMTIGVLTLLALVLYQSPELIARFRA